MSDRLTRAQRETFAKMRLGWKMTRSACGRALLVNAQGFGFRRRASLLTALIAKGAVTLDSYDDAGNEIYVPTSPTPPTEPRL